MTGRRLMSGAVRHPLVYTETTTGSHLGDEMTRHSVLALFPLLLLAVALPASASGAPAPPPTVRAPLAMLAGDVPWPASERTVTVTAGDGIGGFPADPRSGDARGDLLPRIPPDEFLASLMDSVKLNNITVTIQRLQDFCTRYVVSDSCLASATWLADEFAESGYVDVSYDTFRCWSYQDTVDAANIIAVKPGATRPDEYVVIGGHYDSISTENFHDPFAYAPGADDNATGVAGVLEAARILAPLELERSVIFALWSGEEVGLRGSRAWVADAVDAGMDIVAYLNMDVIGYTDEDPPVAVVYCDTTSLAIAGLMQDLIIDHTPYDCVTTVQPIGASDQNSFWEQGFNVLDTSSGAGWSPYHHTPNDIIDHVDLELCRALAAVNVAAAAALAIVVGEDENLPPETVLIANCSALHDTLGTTPRFEWSGVDFDGNVACYEYRTGAAWQTLPADSTGITLPALADGPHVFEIRAIDSNGQPDATPASHEFTVDSALAPRITVTPEFGPAPLVFRGSGPTPIAFGRRAAAAILPGGNGRPRPEQRDTTFCVFENERLVFTVTASADHYCSAVDAVMWALGDEEWPDPVEPDAGGTIEVIVRPAAGDTCIRFRARDADGSTTTGTIGLEVVAAPMALPLLHVDDWFGQEMPEFEHDAIYDALLAGRPHDTWDPYQHLQGGVPQLPTMEELGQYRTVLWTLGSSATLLRLAQAESGYHAVEGFVRAGGNLVIEGHSTLTAFAAVGPYELGRSFGPGDFIYEYAGIDSMRNAGAQSDPQSPETYGYAFLGGHSIYPPEYPHAPVDSLGTWAEGYAAYGGLPSCEVYSTFGTARRIHWFDSYLNEGLNERPCATQRLSSVGCGAVTVLGYPLCYIQAEPARVTLNRALDDIVEWQDPAELAFFTWDAERDHVLFVWYLSPADWPQGAMLERRAPGDDLFTPLGATLITPDEDDRYRFIDATVEPGAGYEYRLVVTEIWGGQTTHGPWTIDVPTDLSLDRLGRPHPNPTPGPTTLSYAVADEHRWVRIGVYSAGGRLIRRLLDGLAGPGRHETTWDGRDETGNTVASGVYFVRADFGPHALERKLVVLR